MGFALWIDVDNSQVWARGTHEYRPMGTAVIARTGLFRHRDFRQKRPLPAELHGSFVGFFWSLEEGNIRLRAKKEF